MDYTTSISTMELWDPQSNKLKYFLSSKFDEHNNKFGKGWSPVSTLMNGTNIYACMYFSMSQDSMSKL